MKRNKLKNFLSQKLLAHIPPEKCTKSFVNAAQVLSMRGFICKRSKIKAIARQQVQLILDLLAITGLLLHKFLNQHVATRKEEMIASPNLRISGATRQMNISLSMC